MPPRIFENPFLILISRVSAFLASSTQQIHSFRASGVMSSQIASTFGSAARALRRSAGRSCTVPVAMVLFVMRGFYPGQESAGRSAENDALRIDGNPFFA